MTFKEKAKKFIPPFLLWIYHFKLAFWGAIFFGFPSKHLTVIGVTGTSGKSTTVDFIAKILEEAHSASSGQAEKVASLSSIKFKMAGKEWENKYKMTMPGRFVIQKFLKQAKNAGCKYAVLEVTSEGIRQSRHRFIKFDAAVFTNLTPEHIESHGGFNNYRKAKLQFFKAVKNVHIINGDDENAKYFLDVPAKKKIVFSLKNAKDIKLKLNLSGKFNVYNALAAIHVCCNAYGIPLETCKKALEKIKSIPGRMEIVQENPFEVVVDYAHTPDQLEAVYQSYKGKRLICVLGSCGGGRDKWKRPVLGQIASKYCHEVFVTNEDPYDEDPMKIINQVAEGAGNAKKVLDRKKAINEAIKMAGEGDVVVITGKGSEPWMCLENGKKIPWSDKAIAKEALK